MNSLEKCTRYNQVYFGLQLIVSAYQYERAIGTHLVQQYCHIHVHGIQVDSHQQIEAHHQWMAAASRDLRCVERLFLLRSRPTVRVLQEVPEFLTWRAQYITRKTISNAFVRTTRPSVYYALVLKKYVLVKLLQVPHMRSSIAQGRFGPKTTTPTVG